MRKDLEDKKRLAEEDEARTAETDRRAKLARRKRWVDNAFDSLDAAADAAEEDEESPVAVRAAASAPPAAEVDWMSRALAALGTEDDDSSGDSDGARLSDQHGRLDADRADIDLLRLTEAISEQIGRQHGPSLCR